MIDRDSLSRQFAYKHGGVSNDGYAQADYVLKLLEAVSTAAAPYRPSQAEASENATKETYLNLAAWNNTNCQCLTCKLIKDKVEGKYVA